MNCVQCGHELPASAKFCKTCGCKVAAAVPAAASPATAVVPEPIPAAPTPAANRGLPAAPAPAYSTCPDCGALCKGDARFCNKCGCRFEEASGFEDTRRDSQTPLTPQEDKAILVFGNVQDSHAPAPDRHGERIDTGSAMVIGGGNVAGAVAAPPSLRAAEPPAADLGQDWLVSANAGQGAQAAAGAAGLGAATASKAGSATAQASAAPVPTQPRSTPVERNPMPQAPAASGGSGKWVALGVVALAVLVGGGAWWWNTQGKLKIGPQTGSAPSAPSTAPAAVAPAAPAVVAAPAPAAVPTDAALAPNETVEPAAAVVPALPEVSVAAPPVPAVVVEEPQPAAAAEVAAPRPAARKPARKQTLDDLLN